MCQGNMFILVLEEALQPLGQGTGEHGRDSRRPEASEPRGNNPHHGQRSRSTVNGNLSCSAYQRNI